VPVGIRLAQLAEDALGLVLPHVAQEDDEHALLEQSPLLERPRQRSARRDLLEELLDGFGLLGQACSTGGVGGRGSRGHGATSIGRNRRSLDRGLWSRRGGGG